LITPIVEQLFNYSIIADQRFRVKFRLSSNRIAPAITCRDNSVSLDDPKVQIPQRVS
jgi:hypothetical protein